MEAVKAPKLVVQVTQGIQSMTSDTDFQIQ